MENFVEEKDCVKKKVVYKAANARTYIRTRVAGHGAFEANVAKMLASKCLRYNTFMKSKSNEVINFINPL